MDLLTADCLHGLVLFLPVLFYNFLFLLPTWTLTHHWPNSASLMIYLVPLANDDLAYILNPYGKSGSTFKGIHTP